jgi:hypothetical protein
MTLISHLAAFKILLSGGNSSAPTLVAAQEKKKPALPVLERADAFKKARQRLFGTAP